MQCYEKLNCALKRSRSPPPLSMHLAEAAYAPPKTELCLVHCDSPLGTSTLFTLCQTTAFSSSKIKLPSFTIPDSSVFPDSDKAALAPDGVSPADLISPSPTQFSLYFGNIPPPSLVQKPLHLYILPLGTPFLPLCIIDSISFEMSSENASLFAPQFWKEN